MKSDQLDPKLLTIGQLFDDSGGTYMVPIYQRNYAWQVEQIEQLLDDIKDAMHDGKSCYFLGNLMVTELKETPTCFEVIDGQQRLTTLYLLLTFLEGNNVLNIKHQERLRYESRPRATEALRRVAPGFLRLSVSSAHSSTTEDGGIHQAYNVIRQFMNQHFKNAELSQFANFLRDKVTVVRASLPRKTDFNRYFEIMNTRGQQLQQVDIVKARLMQHLDQDAQRACFAWIWEACADMDSYVQMMLTRGDTNLRQKIFGDDWSLLTVSSFDQLVTIHVVADDITNPSTSLTLDDALAKYAEMRTAVVSEEQDNVRFRSTIEFPSFLLHVLKVMNGNENEDEGHLDDKRLVKCFEQFLENHGAEKSRRVQEFALKLLRCRNLFDSFILKRQYTTTNSDEGDWSLQRLVKRSSKDRPIPGYINTFSRGSDNVEEDGDVDPETNDLLILQSMLRVTYTSPRTMHWITRLLKLLDESEGAEVTESDLADVLRNYARNKVREAFPLYEPPCGFSINRIVFTYLDYLIWMDRKNPEFRFSFRNSIEHFYPQHPDEQQSGAQLSEECLHLLGNLALVSVGVNSKFSNSLPSAKAYNFQNTIEKQSPKLQVMAEITRNGKAWGTKEVLEHHNAMIKRLHSDLELKSQANAGSELCHVG
ncbi:DUF262 domain-containing protein [Methylomicrobium sp. RS1]|uniref:DUF262 domain-containing protein n=1 Tax=Candidatus Methylomicrobium oryzae TaxID=2802053 RepID=UPI001923F015|nr:DUF262 domain-containing protein [Methylomicrobium sp. RS1]